MTEENGASRQPFGMRRSNVILRQGFQHLRAYQPGHSRDIKGGEGNRRQHEVTWFARSEGRQPAQRHREDQDSTTMPSQKFGIAWPSAARSMMPRSSGWPRRTARENAERHRDEQRDGDRRDGQLNGRRQPLQHHLKGWLAIPDRAAEVEGARFDRQSERIGRGVARLIQGSGELPAPLRRWGSARSASRPGRPKAAGGRRDPS
ncbi:MAG: hypothetical protein KatS3mg060_3600 [Dehalococcoidia bacterium]|nr:MAG: hypothetical protein KatS3mg060_3600 [Dehalococcoidia bacterium]